MEKIFYILVKRYRKVKKIINNKINSLYTELFLLGLICLSSYVELFILYIRYGKNVYILKKGKGALNKFIVTINNQKYLIKKNNKIITYRIKLLAKHAKKKQEYFPERFSHLKKLIKSNYFREVTTLKSIHKHYLQYLFIKEAKTAESTNFNKKKLFDEIKKFILFLKNKGYYSEEIYLHNILIVKKNIKFIDLEGIVKYNEKVHNINKKINNIKEEIIKNEN